jgi:type II secretory pathway pseudopilin PulG
MKRLGNRGDTIIEVLLAIIVVGSVLAGAYVSSSHSLNANRASQERAEALNFVQGQIEMIKNKVSNLINRDGPWCLNSTGSGIARNDFTVAPPADYTTDDWSEPYPANCMVGDGNRYHLSVLHASGSDNYTIRARWDRIGGGGKEQTTMFYKVSP